jgi:hypothetical protein
MSRSETLIEVEPVASPAPARPLEIETEEVARPRGGAHWPVVAIAVVVCVFAVAMTTWVLQPALSQLSASSDSSWNAEGP